MLLFGQDGAWVQVEEFGVAWKFFGWRDDFAVAPIHPHIQFLHGLQDLVPFNPELFGPHKFVVYFFLDEDVGQVAGFLNIDD